MYEFSYNTTFFDIIQKSLIASVPAYDKKSWPYMYIYAPQVSICLDYGALVAQKYSVLRAMIEIGTYIARSSNI